jgi:hypothetical protein
VLARRQTRNGVGTLPDEEPEGPSQRRYQEVESLFVLCERGTRPQPCIDDILPSARISFAIADLVRDSQYLKSSMNN